jgi:spermidine synthase
LIPRALVDTAPMPGGGELRLIRRGEEYSIMLGANELMNSRLSGSEEELARIACARIRGRPRARVLIGGLGMGFTLRAALDALGSDAEVTVAELVPAVVEWARGPLAHLFGTSLDDPRTRLVAADVAEQIGPAGAWDAILLDVDNGPQGLSVAGNDRLYDRRGLAAAERALRPGGVLAVWASEPDAGFTRRLGQAGFEVEEVAARARGGRGARHRLWFATRR